MDLKPISYKSIVKQKLNDSQMRTNLTKAMHNLQNNRAVLIENKFNDWDGLRAKAALVKDKALMTLSERIEEFERHALDNGMKVHFASTHEDACQIIYQIIKDNKVKTVLKGKSMASEEIGLNHFLKTRGIDAIESDLGELIIQLNHESPVHIAAPAIHKNRYQIGQIFNKHLNAPLCSEIEQLNTIARKHLREQFAHMKMGISGVNFAISNEGALWLVENEGNGRMCTTAPDIHVAICGIEKIVESFEDAATLVHLLAPSAAGQFITAYNNIITGPRQANDLDGPKELHVILLDNERSTMLKDKDFYEALRCIRCGACMNFCPVYVQIGGHSYQTTYPGPIGQVISPFIKGLDKTSDILSFCTQCARCSQVCPESIPLANLICKHRANIVDTKNSNIKGADKLIVKKSELLSFKLYAKFALNGALWQQACAHAHIISPAIDNLAPILPLIRQWDRYKKVPIIKGNFYHKISKLEGIKFD